MPRINQNPQPKQSSLVARSAADEFIADAAIGRRLRCMIPQRLAELRPALEIVERQIAEEAGAIAALEQILAQMENATTPTNGISSLAGG